MKARCHRCAVAAAILAIFGALSSSARAADDAFTWPPITSQTRPWAFWWWMGSAVDKTNITRELERYAAAGLGGVHIIPIYGAKGWEDRYIRYPSPEWMEMMGWSVSEAHRLGMGVDMSTGSGWCFGGPQVTDRDANASVIVKTYKLKAGETLKPTFNRESTQALVAYGPDGKVIELTDKISADGTVDWTAPTGGDASSPDSATGELQPHWTVYAISQKPSGQKVKRAGPGGEGWMLNLIYPPAMDDFLKPFTTAFANYHGPKPRAMFQDSYEYRSDWSPDFFAEFQKRRGYRLQDELPALFGTNDNEHSARVKCDYRQTVSEIMAQESLPKWVNWSHEHGFLTRDQAHGSPGNWLDLYADADIPETEMFHTDRNILISKFASSAAHVAGHPLTSAETGTWLGEHFTVTLGDLKGLADDMFLAGVNHIFYHGCCYSPDEAGWPGWCFYASTEMNPRNSIWHDVPALNEYIARVQSVLQSGQADNDILLYWPIEDFWMQPGNTLLPQLTVHARDWFGDQPIGRTAKELWEKGYSFDYVSDAQLEQAKVVKEEIQGCDGKFYEKGIIQMPGGKYQVIFVPECKYMPLETFQKLFAMAREGADIIFEQKFPADIPGLNNLEAGRKEVTQTLSGLKSSNTDRYNAGFEAYSVGKGWVFTAGDFFSGLKVLEGEDQVSCELMANAGLSFVRRAFDGGWNYLVVNRTGTNFDGWFGFERPIKSVVLLDPMTGSFGSAAFRSEPPKVAVGKKPFASSIQIHFQLNAGQSLILHAFATNQFSAHEVRRHTPEAERRRYHYWRVNGTPTEITGNWNVSFIQGGPTLPAPFQTAKLASWTTFPDTNAQAFAGTAKYQLEFNLQVVPGTLKRELQHYYLNLGDVRQSARVRVNGKDYGTLITPPFRVVVDNLKPTGNVLEVEVTSVAANRIRDLDRRGVKWKTFRDINIVDINYKPFDASNWPLTDCGLLGPVTLTPVKVE